MGGRPPSFLLTIDAYLKGLAALVSLVFATIVLSSRPRRIAQVYLGVFLLLIFANQAAELARASFVAPEQKLTALRIATVFAALDPLALLSFAALYPKENRLRSTWVMVPAFAFAALMAGMAVVIHPETTRGLAADWPHLLLTLYTAVVYTIVLAAALRGALDAPLDRSCRILVVAFAVVAAPLWLRLGGQAFWVVMGFLGAPNIFRADLLLAQMGWRLAAFVAALVAIYASLPRGAGRQLGATLRLTWLVAGLTTLVLQIPDLISLLFYLGVDLGLVNAAELFGRGGPALRWLVFGALASGALLRHDMLGMSLHGRRVAARVLVGLTFVVALFPIVLVASQSPIGGEAALTPAELVLFIVVVGMSQGFRALLDRTAAFLYGVPMPGNRDAQIATYEMAVRQASTGAADGDGLERLRVELGLSAAEADVVRRHVQAAEEEPLAVGQLVAERYRIRDFVGNGSGGRVFLAEDPLLGRNVVVKEISAASVGGLREARLAAKVHHPNVVTVHDVIPRRATCLIISEFVAGGSLADAAATRPLSEREVRYIFRDILQGLAAVHDSGIVHRDLKPSNVLITADGRAKIADFGIARLHTDATTRVDGLVPGTPAFMAPEQRRGEPATAASDVFSVGTIALRLGPKALPEELAAILRRATDDEPAKRWRDAAEMLTAWQAHAFQ